jgi:hypothetical protein
MDDSKKSAFEVAAELRGKKKKIGTAASPPPGAPVPPSPSDGGIEWVTPERTSSKQEWALTPQQSKPLESSRVPSAAKTSGVKMTILLLIVGMAIGAVIVIAYVHIQSQAQFRWLDNISESGRRYNQ